ncbi:hypothetical protein NC652_024798 [Populus alba x Populus x berolinensis]|nr:hypothetical protein NC652_024798 [Populus alba x Populus x berolinensis]
MHVLTPAIEDRNIPSHKFLQPHADKKEELCQLSKQELSPWKHVVGPAGYLEHYLQHFVELAGYLQNAQEETLGDEWEPRDQRHQLEKDELHKTLGDEWEQWVQRYQLEKEQHLGLVPWEQQ